LSGFVKEAVQRVFSVAKQLIILQLLVHFNFFLFF
jgi:hypothetical protein